MCVFVVDVVKGKFFVECVNVLYILEGKEGDFLCVIMNDGFWYVVKMVGMVSGCF